MRIYLAGPYSAPDPCINTHAAMEAAHAIMDAGHDPFIPHLTHFMHTMRPRPYEDWMRRDLAFLPVCDVMVRLPGASPGADREEARARELEMRVMALGEFLAEYDARLRTEDE